MKITAFCAGRRNGNTEILLKEALAGAQELGAEVEFIRLNDFELHNCSSCGQPSCMMSRLGPDKCIYKDDAEFLINHYLDSDGVLFGASVYSCTPNSLFFAMRDRLFGPKMDVAQLKQIPPWYEGRVKRRPTAAISVGGAVAEHWTAFGLPCLLMADFSAGSDHVDMMNVTKVAAQGAIVLREDLIERAHQLGRHVAEAVLTGDHRWRGNQEGTCPSCHLNLLLTHPGTNEITCPVCGIYGHYEVDEKGIVKTVWPEDDAHRRENHFTPEGLAAHLEEIDEVVKELLPKKDQIPEKMQKYKDWTTYDVKSPYRAAKKEATRKALMEQHGKQAQ
ncbi:MAG: flavodoxin family protein [Parasporobacterium sp.]|nr:flavodoxin family protein [Parasporobacterium sp.]